MFKPRFPSSGLRFHVFPLSFALVLGNAQAFNLQCTDKKETSDMTGEIQPKKVDPDDPEDQDDQGSNQHFTGFITINGKEHQVSFRAPGGEVVLTPDPSPDGPAAFSTGDVIWIYIPVKGGPQYPKKYKIEGHSKVGNNTSLNVKPLDQDGAQQGQEGELTVNTVLIGDNNEIIAVAAITPTGGTVLIHQPAVDGWFQGPDGNWHPVTPPPKAYLSEGAPSFKSKMNIAEPHPHKSPVVVEGLQDELKKKLDEINPRVKKSSSSEKNTDETVGDKTEVKGPSGDIEDTAKDDPEKQEQLPAQGTEPPVNEPEPSDQDLLPQEGKEQGERVDEKPQVEESAKEDLKKQEQPLAQDTESPVNDPEPSDQDLLPQEGKEPGERVDEKPQVEEPGKEAPEKQEQLPAQGTEPLVVNPELLNQEFQPNLKPVLGPGNVMSP